MYVAHLRTLREFLAVMARMGELPAEAVAPLDRRIETMAALRGAALARSFAELIESMQIAKLISFAIIFIGKSYVYHKKM